MSSLGEAGNEQGRGSEETEAEPNRSRMVTDGVTGLSRGQNQGSRADEMKAGLQGD